MQSNLPEFDATFTETPIDRLLRTQQQLETPVVRIARHKDNLSSAGSESETRFRELIPMSAPERGEQYAFEVNLDLCTGCKACVSACHSMNGLEDNETWRDVGMILGGEPYKPYLQTVTTACHHCEDPACLQGCPVNAYEKDPHSGIVLHLDDQCIGCQYCVLKCPYDVPKYSQNLGIVRKCDMCHSRLAEGHAPACVQACPNEAIRITTVANRNPIAPTLLPGTVDSAYTRPTTRYISKKEIPQNATPADANQPRPEHPHWPLILMLSGTQASVGTLAVALWIGLNPLQNDRLTTVLLFTSAILGAFGLASSTLHLGKPFKAWRAFLGLGHSWLSREIIVFGAFFPFLVKAAVLQILPDSLLNAVPVSSHVITLTALLLGLLGIFCSVMIYHDTRRPFWEFHRTAIRFFGTTIILGSAIWLASTAFLNFSISTAAILLCLSTMLKLTFEWRESQPESHSGTILKNSARLLQSKLQAVLHCRMLLGITGGIILPLLCLLPLYPGINAIIAGISLLLCIGAEVGERYLYFRAVVAFKMPGGIST